MPGSAAETQHGRRGGGWLPKLKPGAYPCRVDVPCEGNDGVATEYAIWSFAPEPELPEEVPVAGGRFVLGPGSCSPDVEAGKSKDGRQWKAWTTTHTYIWEAS